MENIAVIVLLVAALVGPVVVFWLLKSRSSLHGLVAAAIAVAVGWGLNVAWAWYSQGSTASDPSQTGGDNLSIAIRFGWACPIVLVLLTWLVWRFKPRRAKAAN